MQQSAGEYIPGSLVWLRSGRWAAGYAEMADLLSSVSPIMR
jgi:hypothetical protein